MSVIPLLIILSIAFGMTFLAAFIWAVRSGQYQDTCTPSMRLLTDEGSTKAIDSKKLSNKSSGSKE